MVQAADALRGSPCGRLEPTIRGQLAFVPHTIPRNLDIDTQLIYKLDRASRAVATLAGIGEWLPNPHLLIRPFLRREAVLSSRIEGTQASLSDLLLFEASGSADAKSDVREVANYVRALDFGLESLDKIPISMRLTNEMHAVLMTDVRGGEKRPGELRTEQVWIGPSGTPIEDARFIPAPPDPIRDLLHDWEQFVNEELLMPPLIRCALMHYQFETIHPYFDGNGRIGRLLIILFLCANDVLPTPLLYLSAYLEDHSSEYYDHLFNVSATGDWHPWLSFFLDGVYEQAKDAMIRSRRVRALQETYRDRLQNRSESANAFRLLDELFANPFMTAPHASRLLKMSPAGARRLLDRLVDAEIVEQWEDRRPRVHVALELLSAIQDPIH